MLEHSGKTTTWTYSTSQPTNGNSSAKKTGSFSRSLDFIFSIYHGRFYSSGISYITCATTWSVNNIECS